MPTPSFCAVLSSVAVPLFVTFASAADATLFQGQHSIFNPNSTDSTALAVLSPTSAIHCFQAVDHDIDDDVVRCVHVKIDQTLSLSFGHHVTLAQFYSNDVALAKIDGESALACYESDLDLIPVPNAHRSVIRCNILKVDQDDIHLSPPLLLPYNGRANDHNDPSVAVMQWQGSTRAIVCHAAYRDTTKTGHTGDESEYGRCMVLTIIGGAPVLNPDAIYHFDGYDHDDPSMTPCATQTMPNATERSFAMGKITR